ncbi:MAG: hypothetical protein R2867_15525 [Caldilineaceae bacterium]
MYTGETTQHKLANTIYSFSWAPNSQVVAVEEKSDQLVDGFATSILYLLNVRTGEHLPISSEGALLGISGKRILWSSAGDTIAHDCQTAIGNSSSPFIDRVCISQIMLNQ